MNTLAQDLRYAIRTLRRSPGFAGIAVLCLALGIGVNTTIFSAFDGLFLRPLPFENPDRLVAINETSPAGGLWNEISYPNFIDWTEKSEVFSGAAAFEGHAFNLAGENTPVYVGGGTVSTSFFDVLGIEPLLGRTFLPEEGGPDAAAVMVLGHGIWQNRFGGDPGIIGRTVSLNGAPHTVIGVMPSGFRFPERSRVWVPLSLHPEHARGNHSYPNVVRLAGGVTIAQANAALAPISERLQREYPQTNSNISAVVTPLREALIAGEVKTILYIMFGAVGFVLLIACANLANLFLARANGRRHELAIRSAVGAGRGHLLRQLLTEGLVVAAVGGAAGAFVAYWGLELIEMGIPVDLPLWMMRFDVDGRALLFTAAISIATGILFTALPALRASRPDVRGMLNDGARGAPARSRRLRGRGGLVVAEVALSVVLLIGAMLMVRSFLELRRADPGFDASRLVTLRVYLAGAAYDPVAERAAFLREATRRVEALPTVEAATALNLVPLSGSNSSTAFSVEGQPTAPGERPGANYRSISSGYFRALGVPLLRGRDFTDREVAEGGEVVIVNESMAERFWPGESAIGRRIRFGGDGASWYTVVGVAANVYQRQISERAESQFYLPYSSSPWRTMSLIVRTRAADPVSAVPAVRDAIQRVDPALALFQIQTMDRVVKRSFWDLRLYGWMFAAFAGVALLLAVVGVYGVVAYTVAHRTREIGIRMALGAEVRHVLRGILGQSLALILPGLALGLALAFGVTRVLSGFLYGVAPGDPLTFAGVAVFLGSTALLACYIPARRATRVDPVAALSTE